MILLLRAIFNSVLVLFRVLFFGVLFFSVRAHYLDILDDSSRQSGLALHELLLFSSPSIPSVSFFILLKET